MPNNNGILFNGVLRRKPLNNRFVSFSFTKLDFLLPQTVF